MGRNPDAVREVMEYLLKVSNDSMETTSSNLCRRTQPCIRSNRPKYQLKRASPEVKSLQALDLPRPGSS
jgi:hypothetical protein